jgi:2-aminoadipate transaminase
VSAWDEERFLADGLSARARRAGAAYAGPGSGNDVAQIERPPIAFTGGLPDPALLPADDLGAAAAAVLAADHNAALQYGGGQGWEGLREWLAAHWSDLDTVALSPAHFMLANGSAGALAAVCETFLDQGDIAGVELPSFPLSVRAIRQVTPRIESIPVDDDGLDVDVLEGRLDDLERRGERMRLLYIIPSFHNPTGSTLTLERRHRLLEMCQRHGVLIVEDDAYRELYFEEVPPPSLYSLAQGEGVIKLGTFSKIVAPGVRVGWCQASPRLIEPLVATRTDMGTSPLLIRALAHYAGTGKLEPHIAGLRTAYARKCATMLDALESTCSGLATWNQPRGGFFVWMTLADAVDPLALVDAARDEAVTFVGGHVFTTEHTKDEGPRTRWGPGDSKYLRLAFSYVASAEIAEGIARLGRALKSAAQR